MIDSVFRNRPKVPGLTFDHKGLIFQSQITMNRSNLEEVCMCYMFITLVDFFSESSAIHA